MIGYVTELHNDTFEEFIKRKFTLININASWCDVSKGVRSSIVETSSMYYNIVSFGQIDSDKNLETVEKIKIRNVPTVLLFKDGVEIDRLGNSIDTESISEMINRNLEIG